MTKKFNIKDIKERERRFAKGWGVKTYQAVDLYEHEKFGKAIKGKDANLPYSMDSDAWVQEDWFEYTGKDGAYDTDSIIFVEYDYSGKTPDQKNKNRLKSNNTKKSALNSTLEKSRERERELDAQLKDADKEYEKYKKAVQRAKTEEERIEKIALRDKALAQKEKAKKDLEKTRSSIDKTEKRINELELRAADLTEKIDLNSQINKGEREVAKLTKKIEGLKTQKAKDKVQEELNKATALLEENKTKYQALIGSDNGVVIKEKELRTIAHDTGFTVDKVEYSDKLKKELRKNATDKKLSKEVRKKNEELILARNKDEIKHYKITYKPITESAGKSRVGKMVMMADKKIDVNTGEILFEDVVAKELSKSSMGISDVLMNGGKTFDMPGFVSYNSLSQSALVKESADVSCFIEINPKNILVLDDVDCEVDAFAKSLYLDGNKNPKVTEAKWTKANNVLFDGQSLGDSSLFKGRKTTHMSLRQKYFKTSMVKVPLQESLRKVCKENGIDFETAYRIDAYGNKVMLKDVKMITTTNSTKFDKFAGDVFNSENPKKEMYDRWVKECEKQGNMFGICKVEHASKLGEYQQTSYQMINSINAGKTYSEVSKNMSEIVDENVTYLNKLKDDNSAFVQYLKDNADRKYSSEYDRWIDLLDRNADVMNTEDFKLFKSRILSEAKDNIISGKVQLKGDNLLIVQNPVEMIEHAVGVLPVENGKLVKEGFKSSFGTKDDDKYVRIWTKQYGNNEKITCFRSPHSTDANILLSQNKYSDKDNMLNFVCKDFGKNVIAVDDTKFAVQDTLASQDADGDTIFSTSNEKLFDLVEENSWQKSPITLNEVNKEKCSYKWKASDFAQKEINAADNRIGEVVNLEQTAQSQISHLRLMLGENKVTTKVNGKYITRELTSEEVAKIKKQIKELGDITNILDATSCIAIDNAKRVYEIKVPELLAHVRSQECWMRDEDGKILLPKFMENVKEGNVKTVKMDCTMDIMADTIEGKTVRKTYEKGTTKVKELLVGGYDNNKVNKAKVSKTIDSITNASKTIDGLYATVGNLTEDEKKEILAITDRIYAQLEDELKGNMNQETVQRIVDLVYGNASMKNVEVSSRVRGRVLDYLYKRDKEKFLNCFKEGVKIPSETSLKEIAATIMDDSHKASESLIRDVNKLHDEMIKDLNERLENVYYNATKGMTGEQVKKFLNGTMSREEQIAFNMQGYHSRISRLEAIKEEVDRVTGIVRDKSLDKMTNLFTDTIKESYYKHGFHIQESLGIGFTFGQIDDNLVKAILHEDFASQVYDKTMIRHFDKYTDDLREVIYKGMLIGKSNIAMRQDLEWVTGHSKLACERIIRTETTHFANAGEMLAYEESGIEKYVFVATLDNRTSPMCQNMDGKVFNVKDTKVGINTPPLHPFCRSTTIAYFDDDILSGMKRRAKNDPKSDSYVLDKNITYKEWKKEYVD